MPRAECSTCGKAFASVSKRDFHKVNDHRTKECGKKVYGSVKCTRPPKHTGSHYATHPPR